MRSAPVPSPILDAREAAPSTGGASFTLRSRLVRAAFVLCWTVLAAWTPPPLRGWRRLILRAFGARLGKGANVYASARIWHPGFLVMGDYATLGRRVNCYNQALVTLGDYAVVSQDATLCAGTHDYEDPAFQLYTRPIVLGAHCWIAAEAFVGSGVAVGAYAVLGARGVAMRDLEPGTVYAGNPAVTVKRRMLGPRA
jgi:putative colanic acid biosynthesis acetyltransferase WcaF